MALLGTSSEITAFKWIYAPLQFILTIFMILLVNFLLLPMTENNFTRYYVGTALGVLLFFNQICAVFAIVVIIEPLLRPDTTKPWMRLEKRGAVVWYPILVTTMTVLTFLLIESWEGAYILSRWNEDQNAATDDEDEGETNARIIGTIIAFVCAFLLFPMLTNLLAIKQTISQNRREIRRYYEPEKDESEEKIEEEILIVEPMRGRRVVAIDNI